jgi:hypothetical protein
MCLNLVSLGVVVMPSSSGMSMQYNNTPLSSIRAQREEREQAAAAMALAMAAAGKGDGNGGPGEVAGAADLDLGYQRVAAYMQKCAPVIDRSGGGGGSDGGPGSEAASKDDWNQIQAATCPSLLPNLRFHDLVFGTVLGEGAFSVVKYARQITKVTTVCCIL